MGLDICHAIPSPKTDDTYVYFTMDALKDNPEFILKYKEWFTDVDLDNGILVKALYVVDIFVQRKEVNATFSLIFENCKPYFDLASVVHASRFLEARSGRKQKELEDTFKANFIDNFVEGESIFYVSW
jgi:hypothetical protein